MTGSLNASLGQWLTGPAGSTAPYVASQGAALGPAGRVHVSVDDDGTIWVGGGTVTCVEGASRSERRGRSTGPDLCVTACGRRPRMR